MTLDISQIHEGKKNTEDYPSLAEGVGLENRESGKPERGFESLIFRHFIIAGWSSW